MEMVNRRLKLKIEIDMPSSVVCILQELEQKGYEAYIVGECVRDSLLGICPENWEICTSAPKEQLAGIFSQGKMVPGDRRKAPGSCRYQPCDRVDVAGDMTDLKRELEQRIFTIEAMAYGLGVGLVDPFDGRQDLADQRIRCIGKPEDVWKAEEILSCVRLAVRLGYGIDKDTLDSAVAHKDRLIKVPGPWVGDEIIKMFSGNISDLVYQIRCAQPIFMEVLPELKPMVGFKQNNPYHAYDVWRHTLEALSVANGDLIVRLVVLFHDIGKPHCYTEDEKGVGHFYGHGSVSARITDEVLGRLQFDRTLRDRIVELVRYHDVDLHENRKSVRTWLKRMGEDQFRRLLEVRRCDVTGQNPRYIAERVEKVERIRVILDEVLIRDRGFTIKDF